MYSLTPQDAQRLHKVLSDGNRADALTTVVGHMSQPERQWHRKDWFSAYELRQTMSAGVALEFSKDGQYVRLAPPKLAA